MALTRTILKNEGDQTKEAQNVTISTLPSQEGIHNGHAQIGRKFVSLIVETGPAVTLIVSYIWGKGPENKAVSLNWGKASWSRWN